MFTGSFEELDQRKLAVSDSGVYDGLCYLPISMGPKSFTTFLKEWDPTCKVAAVTCRKVTCIAGLDV